MAMKPLEQREEYISYMGGKLMPARDFNHALDIFSTYVYPDALREHCTRQLDFEGEVWYQKTRPIELKSKEELHLARVEEPKKSIV